MLVWMDSILKRKHVFKSMCVALDMQPVNVQISRWKKFKWKFKKVFCIFHTYT